MVATPTNILEKGYTDYKNNIFMTRIRFSWYSNSSQVKYILNQLESDGLITIVATTTGMIDFKFTDYGLNYVYETFS